MAVRFSELWVGNRRCGLLRMSRSEGCAARFHTRLRVLAGSLLTRSVFSRFPAVMYLSLYVCTAAVIS